MRLILADDAVLFREALADALASRGHAIVAQTGNAPELIALVEEHRPDVAIVDIRMPPGTGAAGLEAALAIRVVAPSVGVLLLSHHVETVDVARLFGQSPAGLGYLLKDRVADVGELSDAITRLAAGSTVVDPTIVAAWMGRPFRRSALEELTRREREVLARMAEGRSNHGIAAGLGLTPKTVETHVATIFSKLGLEPAQQDHRRVMAVIAWLREH